MKKIDVVMTLLMALVLGGLFWLRGNLDTLVKEAIMTHASAMTQAKVSVGAVDIRSEDGTGIIRDMQVSNPAGFKTAYALKVKEVELTVDMTTLPRDVVRIRTIAIKAPDVIYEKGATLTNFDVLHQNIMTAVGIADQDHGGHTSSKRLTVELLTVRNATVQVSAPFMAGKTLAVALPDITLRDLGKAKGGLTPEEMGQEVAQAFKQKLSTAVSFDKLVAQSGAQMLDKANKAIKGLFRP